MVEVTDSGEKRRENLKPGDIVEFDAIHKGVGRSGGTIRKVTAVSFGMVIGDVVEVGGEKLVPIVSVEHAGMVPANLLRPCFPGSKMDAIALLKGSISKDHPDYQARMEH
jgi:hypothetical protein